MSDGNGVAIETAEAYEPQPSALEQEIQALLDALTLMTGTTPTQQQEVAASFLCNARKLARRIPYLSPAQARDAETKARDKMGAAKRVLGGGE